MSKVRFKECPCTALIVQQKVVGYWLTSAVRPTNVLAYLRHSGKVESFDTKEEAIRWILESEGWKEDLHV